MVTPSRPLLVGSDPKTDLAVLKVEAPGLPTIRLGDATGLRVGQPVVALGAPLGLSGTVTSGIVSALNREVTAPTGQGGVTVLIGAIQTDASINPGNSGGPLVGCAGRLIGINTAISTVPNAEGQAGGGSVGIGFAVPSQIVTDITDQLLASGRATHPWVGMSTAEISAAAASYLGSPTGLFVQAVATSGPAGAAGL
jgi:putative serine protease PepD